MKVEKGSKQALAVSLGHNESRGEVGELCPGLSGVWALKASFQYMLFTGRRRAIQEEMLWPAIRNR